MSLSPEVQTEFDEQIAAFFQRAPSRAEAEREIARHGDQLLEQLTGMGAILGEYPAYAGMAFYGKMQIADRALITRLSRAGTPASAAIDAIRAHKALRIAASAKAGWDFLSANHLETLWSAIQLNAFTQKPKGGEVVDDPDDEEDDDLSEEDDLWNEEDDDR